MATVTSEARGIVIDVLTTGRKTLGSVHMTLDALNSKAADLHANVTENAEEKRNDMLEHNLVNHRIYHMERMLEATNTLNNNPELAAAYAARYGDNKKK